MLTGGAWRSSTARPVAGAPVQMQLRSVSEKGEVVLEQTVAQAVTGADGRVVSLPVAVAAGAP